MRLWRRRRGRRAEPAAPGGEAATGATASGTTPESGDADVESEREDPWEVAGFTPEDARAWIARGFTADTAFDWHRWGFTAADAPEWASPAARFADAWDRDWGPDVAGAWRAAGFDRTTAAAWRGAGFDAREASRWNALHYEPIAAQQWRAGNFDPSAARMWDRAGFTATEARTWRSIRAYPAAAALERERRRVAALRIEAEPAATVERTVPQASRAQRSRRPGRAPSGRICCECGRSLKQSEGGRAGTDAYGNAMVICRRCRDAAEDDADNYGRRRDEVEPTVDQQMDRFRRANYYDPIWRDR